MEQHSLGSPRPGTPARRRRHGRSRRGPVLPMHLPGFRSRPERFDDAVIASAQRLSERWGTTLESIDFRIRPVPGSKLLDQAEAAGDRVPLASSRSATRNSAARITVYRLPIEQIAESYPEVVDIVHQCVVHELSQLWMKSMQEIDPEYFPDEPD
ncbi:metallopeptidase family protein [Glutamicibacter sp. MNS18]|uniref:metallopeptidase family protein n=1 Tax=Glutamicibacter sp. MNS18 TaxID=2989817 RepID=UPI0022357F18|nr:metallopeptidase family protein [Glutamicibacter sp. MNS18]MCW4465103.1 metallopeptidase family protein [Glutamicibacter sp. MNS18]